MNDPIVDEVRRIRDAYAARFNYDLDAIFQDIKEQERRSGCLYVSFAESEVVPKEDTKPREATTPSVPDQKSLDATHVTEL